MTTTTMTDKERFKENAKHMEMYDMVNEEDKQERQNAYSKKIKPITYTISIEEGENSFFTTLDYMRDVCTIVDGFFSKIETDHEYDCTETYGDLTVDDYFHMVLEEIVNNRMPQLLNKVNIHTSISVSSNKLFVRLEGNIGFGFEVFYNIIDGRANITSCKGTIVIYSRNKALQNSIESYQAPFTLVHR